MKFKDFTAGPDDNDRRLDRVVKKLLSLKSPDNVQSVFALLRKGFIKLNGKKAEGNTRVHEGDILSLADFLFTENDTGDTCEHADSQQNNTYSVTLETVFRNEFLWVINKPYGIPVQPSSSGEISLSQIVENEYSSSCREKSLSFVPGPLHRLDTNTTGLLVFSQNLEGAQWFSRAIASEGTDPKIILKTYIGIVQGTLEEPQLWKDYIEQQTDSSPGAKNFKTVKVYEKENPKTQMAVTEAIPLAYGSHNGTKLTLVQFIIHTGRKHQIRACSSFHHHPLYGDKAYGGKKMIIPGENIEYFLHAIRLDFCGDRPLGLQKDTFNGDRPLGLPEFLEAPLPKEFSTFLTQNLINWNGRLIIK